MKKESNHFSSLNGLKTKVQKFICVFFLCDATCIHIYFLQTKFPNHLRLHSACLLVPSLITAADRYTEPKQQQQSTREQNLSRQISFTYLPLVLLLVLLTESELEERLREPDPLWERGGRVAWLASLWGEGFLEWVECGDRLRLWR